jgi:glutathione synthase/RimK-type ligase-like ATP-grasp enzyme
VGEKVYASEILSQADDYRYAARYGLAAEIRPATLPDDIVVRCRSVTAALGLLFAGIDLRLTSDGHCVCFEVNPSPGFTYYEAATGQPLALAVARLLSSAERQGQVTDGRTGAPRQERLRTADMA